MKVYIFRSFFIIVFLVTLNKQTYGQDIHLNDAYAKATLRSLSVAAESYAADNRGKYPVDGVSLTNANPPYTNKTFCGQAFSGYNYDCNFTNEGYTITATPIILGSSGTTTYIIKTGGVLTPQETLQPVQNKSQTPEEWKICETDNDCTAAIAGGYHWEPVNKKYISKFTFGGCLKCVEPGNQPVTACVEKKCVATDKTTSISMDDWLKQQGVVIKGGVHDIEPIK